MSRRVLPPFVIVIVAASTAAGAEPPVVTHLATIQGHAACIRGMAFHPDGTKLITVGDDGQVKQWRVTDRVLEHTLVQQPGLLTTAAFAPQGRTLVTGGGKLLRFWDVETRQERPGATLTRSILQAAVSPDGRRVALALFLSQTAEVREMETGAHTATLSAPAPRGPEAGTPRDRPMATVAYSPDGSYLALCIAAPRQAAVPTLFDAQSHAVRARFVAHPFNRAYTLSFSPDSRALAIGTQDGQVKLFDVAAVVDTWNEDRPSGEAGDEDRPIPVLSPSAMPSARQVGSVRCVAFSPDGTLFAAGSMQLGTPFGQLSVWRISDLRQLVFDLRDHAVHWLAFSPDGRMLVTGLTDGRIGFFGIEEPVES